MKRRDFISLSALAAAGIVDVQNAFAASDKVVKPRHILLRSGWQVENIGDIAHSFATLSLIQKYIPCVKVTWWFWYSYLPSEEMDILCKNFPHVQLVLGKVDADGKASTPELQAAYDTSDFFLHNSGPATVGWQDAQTFKKIRNKPFGVFGVTYGLYGMPETDALSQAAFVYLRDSVSLQRAKQAGIKAPVLEFGPDAVFSFDLQDDKKARALLKSLNLEEGKFLCCIPRHRFTPVWEHPHKGRPLDSAREKRNEDMAEHDHAPLRDAIIAVVRDTTHKVLICNEDETQQRIGKEWLLDKLPDDVKLRVVWMDRHWFPDEAASVYKRSAGLFGLEMHSPILCIANGVPAIVGRFEEQSSKGYMWRDIGLGDWLFNFDSEDEIKLFAPEVLKMAKNTKQAKAKALAAKKLTSAMHKQCMAVLEKASRPA